MRPQLAHCNSRRGRGLERENRQVSIIVLLTPAIVPLTPAYLAADFACRELDGMDVPISGVRPQRVHESVEVADGQILCRGPDHAGRREHACHRAAIRRAWLGPERPVAEIRAQGTR
jgi:hypothetical protein